jgi:hypothetical protein
VGAGFWQCGDLFFGDQQRRVCFKRLSRAELKVVRGLLAAYSRHVEANRDTALQHWYGLFRFAPGPAFLVLGNPFVPGVVDALIELTGKEVRPLTGPPASLELRARAAAAAAAAAAGSDWGKRANGRLGRECALPLGKADAEEEGAHFVRRYDDAAYGAELLRGDWAAMGGGRRGRRAGIVLWREDWERMLGLLRADTEFLAQNGVSGYTLVVGVQVRSLLRPPPSPLPPKGPLPPRWHQPAHHQGGEGIGRQANLGGQGGEGAGRRGGRLRAPGPCRPTPGGSPWRP